MPGSAIYRDLLLKKQHGLPLWSPDTNENLQEHMNKGISIGDLGILTNDGGFRYLFNIHAEADAPVNNMRTPQSFTPLPMPTIFKRGLFHALKACIYENATFETGGTAEVQANVPGIASVGVDLTFTTTHERAAMLYLPHGADREDTESIGLYEEYAVQHGESWYKFVNEDLKSKARNGSLYLVTGCDKSGSWALAAGSPRQGSSVRFAIQGSPGVALGSVTAGFHGSWMNTSGMEGRHYPSLIEHIVGVKNQCVFVRGLAIAIRKNWFPKPWLPASKVDITDVNTSTASFPAINKNNIPFQSSVKQNPASKAPSGNASHSSDLLDQEQDAADFYDSEDTSNVIVENYPEYPKPVLGPASYICERLLSIRPDINLVIVHDNNWMMVTSSDDENIFTFDGTDYERLTTHVLQKSHLQVTQGMTLLLQRPYQDPAATIEGAVPDPLSALKDENQASIAPNAPAIPPPPVAPQKAFVKTKAVAPPPQSPIPPQSSSDNVAPNAPPDNRETMASQPKPTRKRDKFMALLRSTPQPPESTNNITASQPPPSPIPPQSSSDSAAPTAPNAPSDNREAMASQPKPTRTRDKVMALLRSTPQSTSNITATQPSQSPIPPQSFSDNVAPTAPNAPSDNREAMASQPKPTRTRDKFMALLRSTPRPPGSTSNITATQPSPSPIPPQSSSDNVAPTAPNTPAIPPPPVAPQKAFAKSKMFEKDIAVLSISYIIAENPELKKLIHLIIGIHAKDEQEQLTGVLETCARFSVQLASAIEAHRAESTEAITVFIKTVEKLNSVDLKGSVQYLDTLKQMVNDEVAKVKSSNPLFAHDRDFATSDRLSKLLTAIIDPSITILTLVKDAGSVIPVPWIQGVIGGVLNLLNALKQTRSNYDDMRQIAATAGEFAISCAVICSDHTTESSNEFKRALNKFTKTLEGVAEDCEELSQQNRFWRYFQQNVQKDTLQGIRTRLDNAIKQFQNESQIHIYFDINELSKKFDYVALNGLPNHPRYDHAEYLDGSRDDVLREISDWIDKRDQAILWIHGAAGLGKSTIGQQLVRLLKADDCLAGGVFLTNLAKEHPETVIQVISRQLGEMHPRAIANIAEAARKLNGPHNRLRDYFTDYLINPILQLKYPYQLVVVMDGLEEWISHESFLAELAHLPSPSPVKFILTSRPSYSVERVLKKIPNQPYLLPPVSQEIIERYFSHHFERIDWRGRRPDRFTISRLAAHAQGLLIWAATVRSLLSHEFDQRYPHQILEQILLSEEKVGARSGEQLERLYHDAITILFPKPDMQEMLHNFLGAMMVLEEPLPLRDFARLLGMSDQVTEEIQRRLTAFQTRGQLDSGVIPPAIQQFHISFLEYMESTSIEHHGQSIAISTANAHLMLADRCLNLIFSEFLPSYRGKICTYSELRGVELYAIKYWPLHLSNGTSRLILAPSVTATLTAISDEDMRRWATLFLPCVAARFWDEYESLDNIPKHEQLFKLAEIIGKEDISMLPYRLYCLETAVRLQPIDVKIWIALGNTYVKLYKHGRYNKDLDEEISVFRHALQLVSPKLAGEESLHGVNADSVRDNEGRTYAGGTDPLSDVLSSLAFALNTCFDQRGAESDLDEAISLYRETLVVQPAPHPDRPRALRGLALALKTRFEKQGTMIDRDEADLLRQEAEALSLQPSPHSEPQ